MKEFKLSEKRFTSKCGWDVIQTNEVKEFIKLILEEPIILPDLNEDTFTEGVLFMRNRIKKRAGDLE